MTRVGRMRGGRRMGQPLNLPSAPQCPPGYHWEATPSGPIQGMSACVPNRVIVLHAPPPAPAPAPHLVPIHLGPPPLPPASIPVTPAPTVTSSPGAPTYIPPADTATAPVYGASATCDSNPWPLWWLLVAAAVGGGVGYWAAGNKGAKKEVKRMANAVGARIVNHASGPLLARMFG